MKTKRLLALLLAMLMVLSVVLTACGPSVINPGENPGSHVHGETNNEGNTNPEQTSQCAHATTELKNAKEASCAVPGYTGDQVCTACGATVSTGEAIAQLTHVSDEGVVTYPSTCLMPGIKAYSCTLCKEVLKTASYPASGSHTWGDWSEVASTCVVLGYKVRVCTANGCNATEKVNLTEYGDHDLVWTDNLNGTHSADCRDCDHAVTNQAHTTVGDTTWHDATCTLPGYTEGTCSLCGAYKAYDEANHPATDHNWGEWDVKPATCVAKGSKTRACQDCTATGLETFEIDVDAHTYVYKDEKNGTHTVTCANSGCQYTANAAHAPAAGNTLTRHEATCTSPAYDEGVCDTCGETYRIYVEGSTATGHTWGEWQTVNATCTTTGSKTRTCTVVGCGESESSVLPVVADAHVWVIDYENTVEATCQAAGVTYYVCSEDCGATKSVDVARLPHNLGDEVVNGSFATQSCTNDGCTHVVKRTVVTDTPISSDAIKENVGEGESLEVQTGSNVAIQFPSEVVDQMTSGDTAQNVSISAGTLSEDDVNTAKNNMDAQTKELFESTAKGTVYDFNAKVGETAFDKDNTFAAKVMITVPYTLTLDDPNTPEDEGEDPDGIYIWYMADDGTIEKVLATFVCENEQTGEGYVWFELDHFSRYAIAYEETQEIKCRKGIHLYENKGEPVVATCVTPGYQMRECTSCHVVDFTDWVEPTGHVWENRTIDPTCTEYGVTVRECENCDAMEEIPGTVVRPTGHTLPEGAVASCTADVICTSCEKVMIKGEHIWSEWITIKEPTEVASGERKRECLRAGCDHAETITLAATGNIKPFDFASYEELVALIFDELLGFKMGTISFELTLADGYDVDFDVTIRKENGKYVVLVEGTADNGKKVIPFAVMYRDGMLIDLSDTESVLSSADLESIIMMPFDVMMDYCENLFNMVEPMAGSIFDSADAIYDLFNTSFGAAIDAKLAAAESEFRVAEIKATIDSMRSVYAYWAMKMGWTTSVSIIDGAEIPTKADFLDVLGALMNKTENADGTVTYTWDPTELLEAIDTALTWIIDNEENTLGEIIYESYGDKIAERYPDLTDWAAVEAKLNEEFAGSMKLKDAIDKILTVIEIEEIGTVDQLYRFINDVAVTALGMESGFDVEAMIAENYDLTLDELVSFMMSMAAETDEDSASAPTFAQMLSGLFAMTVGDVITSNGQSLVDIAQTGKDSLAAIELVADFALTVDAKGNLIGLTVGQQVTMDPDGENEMIVEALSLTVKADTTVQIVVPEHAKPIVDAKVETSFDEDGNLIVKVPAGYDYELSLSGSGYVSIADVLEPNQALSAEYGCTVYMLKEGMWQKSEQVARYILIDGKYYEYIEMMPYSASGISYGKALTMPALAANPALALPDVANEDPVGIYTDGNGGEHFVYTTLLNPVVQIDGVWYMLRSYSSMGGYYDEDLDLYLYNYQPDTEADLVAYEGLVNDLRVSSISSYYHYSFDMGGKTVYVYNAYLTINNNDAVWGANRTIQTNLYFDEDDNCVLFARNINTNYEYYPLIGKQVTTLPSHDKMNRDDGYNGYIDANGNLVEGDCSIVYLSNTLPTYYVEVTEGVYVDIDRMTTNPVLFNDTMELSDGNILHIYRSVNWNYSEEFDRIVYGYVACGELYAQVAVLYCGDELLDVVYRYATTEIYCGDFDAYLDIEDYLTGDATNGYVIGAKLIEKMQSICTEYDGFSIALHCTKTLNGVDYTYFASAYTYFLMGNELPGFGGSHSEVVQDIWQGWYNHGDQFIYVKNEDGSISIATSDGSKLTVDFSTMKDGYPIPEELYTKNEEKSEETGLEIYDALIGAETEKYLYLNGQYYSDYDFVDIWDPTYTSLSKLIGENWRISSLTYFTTTDYTKNDVTTQIDVYVTNIRFGDLSYCVLYMCMMDGKLYVLSNGTQLTESTIKYDDLVLASVYLDTVAAAFAANAPTPTNESVSWYSPVYINGDKTVVYQGYVAIGASNATIYYTKNANGTISYILEYDHTGYVLEKGDSVTIDTEAYTVTTIESWGNVKYTFVKVYAPVYVTYVKLADKYYLYSSYMDHVISEDYYWQNLSERDWYYYIEDEGGNRIYYNGVEDSGDNTFTLYDETTDLPELVSDSISTVFYGMTVDGKQIYYVSGALPRSFEELDDGTVFFYDEGETEGYLKTQAGTYLSATKIQGADGAYIQCNYLRAGNIADEALLISGIFDDVVTVNAMGNVVTIDEAILDMIYDGFYLEINGYRMPYSDLLYYLTQWEG